MEWLTCIRKSIAYIEDYLTDDISIQDIAGQIPMSPFFLQRGFSVITGYGIAEYIRNRRLYLAALDLVRTEDKVIDIAFRYGYDTPESFSKAFSRFHGSAPSLVRSGKASFRSFLPVTIQLTVRGGTQMDHKITKMFPFKVIGFQKEFGYEEAWREIPKFWDEICEKYAADVYAGNEPANLQEKALVDNCIGEYGVCIDDLGDDRFRYLIAGRYTGGDVPDGVVLYEFPAGEWAIFDCIGPIPQTLQDLNTRIFKEWLPGNPDYELSGSANVEWYDAINGEKTDPDYHSAIWLPVKRKDK